MAIIQLQNRAATDAVMIPGIFLDAYLPAAKGEDLKVFLYLLRAVSRPGTAISLASLSDTLDLPEKEVLRALTYWEKAGFLQLSFNSDHVLEGIALLDMNKAAKQQEEQVQRPDSALSEAAKTVRPAAQTPARPVPRDLTPGEIAALDGDLDFNALIFMAEQCFGMPLTSTDINRLGYWFVNFGQNTGILEALLEYCAEQCRPGRPNTRYLDTVAAGWFSEGITSSEQARERSRTRSQLIYGVMKAFGIKNRRDPNPAEQELIRKWSRDYGFSAEMIILACTRTAAKTSQDQFAYADRVLTAWHNEHLTSPREVQEADFKHRKRTAAARRPVEISKSARQFHNFEERDTDYEELILNQYRRQG